MNTNTRQKQYREQVLGRLINETNVIHNENINWYNIELPFSIKRVYGDGSEKPSHKEQFIDHVTDNYGILLCEVDELWRHYTKYVTDLHISLGKQTDTLYWNEGTGKISYNKVWENINKGVD